MGRRRCSDRRDRRPASNARRRRRPHGGARSRSDHLARRAAGDHACAHSLRSRASPGPHRGVGSAGCVDVEPAVRHRRGHGAGRSLTQVAGYRATAGTPAAGRRRCGVSAGERDPAHVARQRFPASGDAVPGARRVAASGVPRPRVSRVRRRGRVRRRSPPHQPADLRQGHRPPADARATRLDRDPGDRRGPARRLAVPRRDRVTEAGVPIPPGIVTTLSA